MGGTISIDDSVLEAELLRFKTLIEEPIGTRGWEDREVLGVHTQLSSKIDESGHAFSRGVVDVEAPLELVLWVIRNQTETFDGLREISLVEYLDPEVTEFIAKRSCAPGPEKDGVRTLRWSQELPRPARKREFFTTEIVRELDGVTFAIQTSQSLERHQQRPTRKNSAVHLRQLRTSLKDLRSRSSASLQRASSILQRKSEGELGGGRRRPRQNRSLTVESGSRRRGSKAEARSVRGEVVVHGFALETLASSKTRVSCLSCIDLLLDHLDFSGVDPLDLTGVLNSISGMGRVLMDVERLYRYFTEKQALLVERLYRLASAELGDLGFEETFGKERRKTNELQTGTRVVDQVLGRGVVTRFDMYGNTFAQFNGGNVYKYSNEDVMAGVLEAVVEVGTRVVHTTFGKGTVKQFDDDGNIHVKFDTAQRYEVIGQDDWDQVIKQTKDEKVVGAGGTGHVTMSKRTNGIHDDQSLSTGQLLPTPLYRISFVIDAPVDSVLRCIDSFKEDESAGNILKDDYLDEKLLRNAYFTSSALFGETRIRYQLRKMSKPLDERDFLFAETYKRVDSNTYVLLQYSIPDDSKPVEQGIIRGNVILRGFLLEPLYKNKRNPLATLVKGRKLSAVPQSQELNSKYTKVTYLSCVDVGGFVPPKTAETEAEIELLGVLTELRAHFYTRRQSTQTALKSTSKPIRSAKSKRIRSKRLEARGNSRAAPAHLSKSLSGSQQRSLDRISH